MWVVRGARVIVFSVLLAAAFAVGRAIRRGEGGRVARSTLRAAPLSLSFAAFVAVGGGAIVRGYTEGDAGPFVALATALFALTLVVRAWGAAGAERSPHRMARSVAAALAALATALLVLASFAPSYLEAFGL
jgi:hypothetical protein